MPPKALSATFMKACKNKALLILFVLFTQFSLRAQQIALPKQRDRWSIEKDGSITWNIGDKLPHADHIEMSGEKVSLWIAYAIDSLGVSKLTRTVVFPTFRMLPDDTSSHIAYTFGDNELPRIYIDNRLLRTDIEFRVKSINQYRIMRIMTEAANPAQIKIERTLFPSV